MRRRVARSLAVLGCCVAGIVLPAGRGSPGYIVPAAAGSADAPPVRPMIPDLLFHDSSGIPVHLRRYLGRVVVLNFWSQGCGPCLPELLHLDRLQGDMKGKPLNVVALSEDDNGIPAVRSFFARQKLTFLQPYTDADGAAAQLLGVRGLPSSVIIDPYGRVVLHLEGRYQWDDPRIMTQLEGLMPKQ